MVFQRPGAQGLEPRESSRGIRELRGDQGACTAEPGTESQGAWARAVRGAVSGALCAAGRLFTHLLWSDTGVDKNEQSHWRPIHPFRGSVFASQAFSPQQAGAGGARDYEPVTLNLLRSSQAFKREACKPPCVQQGRGGRGKELRGKAGAKETAG